MVERREKERERGRDKWRNKWERKKGKGREREKKRIIEEGRRIKEEQGDGGQSTSLDGDLRPRRRA